MVDETKATDDHSVLVKSEYILTERDKSLPVLKTPPPSTNDRGDDRDRPQDDRDRNNTKNRRRKKGQNKKRPRDARADPAEKLCLAILRGEECPFGDSCKFSHDIKAILSQRPPDIAEIKCCPQIALKGKCDFGLTCRVATKHIDETGKNLGELKEGWVDPVSNYLKKETMIQLRKNQYPFQTKRHFDKDKKAAPTPEDVTTPASELKPRKLIDFRNKVYVAPLTTVGNLPFRRITKLFGADITCGEMALAENILKGKPSEWALLKRHSSEDVFGIQLASGFADQFTRCAELLEGEHVECDFVDCNLGCPIDLVCEKGAGASLMLREKRLKEILTGITGVLRCPVTVKIRTGWDGNKPIAHSLVPKIQGWGLEGIAAVMIHGRSRLQRYSRIADWDYIRRVSKEQSVINPTIPPIPIIGNGDIYSYTDYQTQVMHHQETLEKSENEETPPVINPLSTTAMIARGALIKPWLPTEIKESRHWDISSSERLDMLRSFTQFGLEHWGSDQQGVNSTRRFLLEFLSFLYRYVPVGLLERCSTGEDSGGDVKQLQQMNQRPPAHMCGRNDLETLMLSNHCADWIKLSEMLLGPVPDDFQFEPKHRANGYK